MFNSLSIKTKLVGLTLLGLLIAGIIGGYCYGSIQQLNGAMNKIVTSSTVLRNHMYADMMHDALNSDVNAALLASENIGGNNVAAIELELKEHSNLFTEALNKNETLISDTHIREAIDKALPALKTYIESAEHIVQTAKTDRDAAIKMMDAFHKAFTSLEVAMEDLTVLIEKNVELTQKTATEAKASAVRMLLIILVLGIAITLSISMMVIKNITVPLQNLLHVSERVAAGDLTVRIDNSSSDELGQLARAMEKMRGNLTAIISEIGGTTAKLLASVGEISAVTQVSSANMVAQRSETEQVAAAMNEMTATVHEVASNIVSTAASAQKAAEETHMGGQIVQEAARSITVLVGQIDDASEIIHRLEQNSHNISSVLDVIRNIAEQTNLLALNAAIEAARAGEQGRGFAVVADEVRTLASRTQQSTGEINEMISQLQAESKLSVQAMSKSSEQAGLVETKAEKAGHSLTTIAKTVTHISDLSAQIATAAEEQTAVSEEINRNIVHISEAATATADGTLKTQESIHQLSKIATDLQHLVKQFKISH